MLILTRTPGKEILITSGDRVITVTVKSVKGNRVRLGIEAPREVKILRGELDDDQDRKAA